jgi:RND family efflux transporter MFP subunit
MKTAIQSLASEGEIMDEKQTQAETESQTPEAGSGKYRLIVKAGLALAAVVLVLLWLAGTFHTKVKPGLEVFRVQSVPADATLWTVRSYDVPRVEWAVGSVQAVHETAIGSKLLAKVIRAEIKAGQPVKEGEILLQLDDSDLKIRVEQAKFAAEAAKANFDQAKVEFDRVMRLSERNAASAHEINTMRNQFAAAQAKLSEARQTLEESKTFLTYATIRAPYDGMVIDKKVEVGDMVTPGQILLTLYNPRQMQLVATVRESLAGELKVGQKLRAEIPALRKLCEGTVAEIVPKAQAASRSLDVKVVGPCPPGIYTGMFGRLLIPLGKEKLILIPQSAIARVGQLELAQVVETQLTDGKAVKRIARRSIQTGRRFDAMVEVLSGLNVGDQILLAGPLPAAATQPSLPIMTGGDTCETTK